MHKVASLATALILLACTATAERVNWERYIAHDDAWFKSAAGQRIIANVLSWQSESGTWPKNFTTADGAASVTTTTTIYLTDKKPPTVTIYHTVADVACRDIGCDGAGGVDSLVELIWDKKFAAPFPDGTVNAAGDYLTYYGAGSATPQVFTTASLFQKKDGRCGAWKPFLADCLSVHGITSTQKTITSTIGSGIVVDSTLPGQNNASPLYVFTNHAVVDYKSASTHILYDPSYGKSYSGANRLRDWEDASLTHHNTTFGPIADNKGVLEVAW